MFAAAEEQFAHTV